MAGLDKIEGYLIALGVSYEEVGPATWIVEDQAKGLPRIVVSVADPICVLRAEVTTVPAADREKFYAELLTLNGESLVHGAYALDGDKVILVDTLEYEGMDKDEFEATLESMGFALAEHYPKLSRYK